MVNMATDTYPVINGGLMQSYVGQQATLFGRFESVDGTGRMLKIKTTDGNYIVAVCGSPIAGPVPAGSCVLLQGVVEHKNKFKPSAVHLLPPDVCDKFDDSLWNDMVAILVENPDLMYEFTDLEQHFGVADVSPDGGNADIIPFPVPDRSDQADGKAAGESFADESFTDNF